MLEGAYQRKLITKLERVFPGCVVLKNDAGYLSGVPDLLVLHANRWAMLEVKRDAEEVESANMDQKYFVRQFNMMSFAAFIYPANEEEVLNELKHTFAPGR